MIDQSVRVFLLSSAFNAAVKAGAAVMHIYRSLECYDITLKSDHTPITMADRLAHQTIKDHLGRTRIPILSEEGREMRFEERCNWEMFWLVDPLDGTVEFIKRNNEFTINIALMENNVCQGAVIYVPCLGQMYIAERGRGAFVRSGVEPDAAADYTYDQIVCEWQRLPLHHGAREVQRVAVSRSHQTSHTHDHIEALKRRYDRLEVVEQGSSYKFCMLAEGVVDYYVRTSETYEWDTAAGELLLAEAGGRTESIDGGTLLSYNKEDLLNPWFVCRSKYSRL